jgi:hypothetical protein
MTNNENSAELLTQVFAIRASSFIRHSSFGLRHSFVLGQSDFVIRIGIPAQN